MKVVIADRLAEGTEARVGAFTGDVSYRPELTSDELPEACRDAHVLVVRSTRVGAEVFQSARHLELVVRAGAGTNTIDVEAASHHGVFVANCPGRNAVAVAELALGLIISLDRRIPDNVSCSRAKQWEKSRFSKASGLAGRTLSIAGFGKIGEALSVRAQAMGMRVVAWSRSLTETRAEALGIERSPSLEALVSEADILSIHLALTDETRNLFGAGLLGRLREGALLVNTARAELIDEAALLEAVHSRGVRAALDVIDAEPSGGNGRLDTPLADHPDIYLTHHIGASTQQAQSAVADAVVAVIETYQRKGTIPACVNLRKRSPATHQLVVRHQDQVGVLASVLQALSEAGYNAEEMNNIMFASGGTACCYIQLVTTPSEEIVSALRTQPHVLGVSVQEI